MQYAFLRGEAILVLTLDQTNIFYKFHHLVPFYKSLHIFEEKKKEIPGAKIKNIGKLQYM